MKLLHEETLTTIQQLVADVCALDATEVRPEGELLGYGLESVLALDLILEIEHRWSIALPEHDPGLRSVRTVHDLVRLIESRRSSL
jgi:acyl carrier protein